MAETIPVGSNVSAGTYRCTSCGYEMGVITGGDAADHPYPDT